MTASDSHQEIAARVSDDLAANESVEAILLVGSVALGYADEYSDVDLQVVGSLDAGEQFVALAYVLDDRVPPYRSWLFTDVPMDLPEIDDRLSGDVDALTALSETLEPELRTILADERIEHPYRFQPEFGPLG